ncbi:MAG TPA: DUF6591 domain-containing protein [Flavobacterium sp.]|jgi:hypothetical protein
MNKKILKSGFALLLILATACGETKKEPETEYPVAMDNELTESSENAVMEETSTPETDQDWDKMLDDYEEYVDEYLKFYKESMSGNTAAISEYTEMMQKATALQESMADAQNNGAMSASQINRMMKIQTKMSSALMEMQ